jgi:hypothetical protein
MAPDSSAAPDAFRRLILTVIARVTAYVNRNPRSVHKAAERPV